MAVNTGFREITRLPAVIVGAKPNRQPDVVNDLLKPIERRQASFTPAPTQ